MKLAATTLTAPFVRRLCAAPPSETLRHASIGASGMAWADIQALTASPHVQLVAVAEVDRSRLAEVMKRFPGVRVYEDGRELFDRETKLDSVNVSTPDHMHAYFAMRALDRGLHVYCQKPLTHCLREARKLTEAAAGRKTVTQMGIQIHAHGIHRSVVRLIQDGAIGKVKEVHSWSGKGWGDTGPRPNRSDPVPDGFNWNLWLGGAAERPFLKDYYHPGVWRKRLDFGTGTFGDMACHILDPVFTSLALTAPTTVRSEGPAPGPDSWSVDVQVSLEFPATRHTAGPLPLHWYNGHRRPPAAVQSAAGTGTLADQGTIYIGEKGTLVSPYIDKPVLLPADRFADYRMPDVASIDHYRQFVDACRGVGTTETPFSYAGPLTESVLLGCLATRFPQQTLTWDATALKIPNNTAANSLVGHEYRQGWEV